MMPQKRRIVESSKGSNKEEKRHFEAYYVTGVTSGGGLGRCGSPNHLELTACHTDYQVCIFIYPNGKHNIANIE